MKFRSHCLLFILLLVAVVFCVLIEYKLLMNFGS